MMTDLSELAAAFWRVMPADPDPVETGEWIDAFASLIESNGRERATYLLRKLLDEARARRVPMPPVLNTPYCNSIALSEQPQFPGNLDIEARISAIVRWNALAMVVRANRGAAELGGHIATYASIADLFEVGYNHFFRAGQDGDAVFFQPHASPGVYARAWLEGRLMDAQLDNYRRETAGPGTGLSSYCHPYLMPDFWQFPNASMGLGPVNAIYQARFMRYLEHRSIRNTSGRKVWAFVGDGEMDEPESLAGLSLAAREGLDNLIFVVNCNLQRLDGPVRGNGSLIQELEGLFSGAGWHVIKLLWGSEWDPLFARDTDNVILKRLHETVDGEFQKYAATDGRFNREHFFNKDPELQALVSHLSDDDIDRLRRGGHDPVKIYAAYHAAVNHQGRPTVILAQTKKGYGMGHWGQGKMGAHQQKKLEDEALLAFRDRFAVPISDADVKALKFWKPAPDSPEMRYLHARRQALDGYLPKRVATAPKLVAPAADSYTRMTEGSGSREESTTMAFVKMLAQMLKDPVIGKHIVPIVADEARTFGMQSLFRQVAIYSPFGQLYEPEDRDELLYYKEARDGQILEEGINEAGAISSWIAAATSYSVHGTPMLPFYIFYSMFGFQRIGDLIWQAGDCRSRGFLIGATAGRTTLSGEGLQHQDGSSQLIASTVPNCRAWDPAFGYELATIIQDGTRRMMTEQEDVFYYITVMNENYPQPPMPAGVRSDILSGMYLLRSCENADVQLLGSGTIVREVSAAGDLLEQDFGIAANIWSVTSWSELRRDGMDCERHNRLHPLGPRRTSHLQSRLSQHRGPVIAASDHVATVPDLIRAYIPRRYVTLGTDGYGRSDSRENLRRFFEMDRHHIVVAALAALADENLIPPEHVAQAIERYGINVTLASPWTR
jgi:pyruvate dehydrogenase E1 component